MGPSNTRGGQKSFQQCEPNRFQFCFGLNSYRPENKMTPGMGIIACMIHFMTTSYFPYDTLLLVLLDTRRSIAEVS